MKKLLLTLVLSAGLCGCSLSFPDFTDHHAHDATIMAAQEAPPAEAAPTALPTAATPEPEQSSSDSTGVSSTAGQPAGNLDGISVTAEKTSDIACDLVAGLRAEDAATNGFDDDIQRVVHDRALAECRAHRSPGE